MARTEISATDTHRASGFTLLELLIVLAVAGLVAAIAVPNIRIPGFASGAAQAARGIAARLAEVRQQAIFSNAPVELAVDIDRLTVRFAHGADEPLVGVRSLSLVTIQGGVRGDAEGVIRFFPDGSATGGEIAVTGEDGRIATIRINWLTGRIDLDA